VLKGMYKVSQNPLPNPNGYGKPLGNKDGSIFDDIFEKIQ
jgi:mRNA interferase RelE/StbE